MALIKPDDIQKASKIKLPDMVTKLIFKSLKLDALNDLYILLKDKKTQSVQEFTKYAFEELNIKVIIPEQDLKNIPLKGGFITVSNHPFGALDGLGLLNIIPTVREDYKVMGNFLLQKIKPMEHSIIPVDPFEGKNSTLKSLAGVKEALKYVQEGHSLGIFPAGEVASFSSGEITDKVWHPSAIKIIKKAKCPVVPVYFEGKNSIPFYLLGLIHPKLRTVRIPHELLNKKDYELKIRIGKPISAHEIEQIKDVDILSKYLRMRTYALSSEKSSIASIFFFKRDKKSPKAKDIMSPISKEVILEEIENLKKNHALFQVGDYHAFLCEMQHIPETIKEIGRLREITYRNIGEGSLNALDIDEFDLTYKHLLLWDNQQQKLVGGYRLGIGNELFNSYKQKGFYISTLFEFDKKINPMLKKCLEMGRSFVIDEYQKKGLPLFLLWKGIVKVLENNPQLQYIIGPVSISNSYSDTSKYIMIEFIKKFYFDKQISQWVKPKNKVEFTLKNKELKLLKELNHISLKELEFMIEDIEQNHVKMPVLIKKYLMQNALFIGFNRDPKFNNAIDALMYADISKLSQEQMEKLK